MEEVAKTQLEKRRRTDSERRGEFYKEKIVRRKKGYEQVADIQTRVEKSLKDLSPEDFHRAYEDVNELDLPQDEKRILRDLLERLHKYQAVTAEVHRHFIDEAKIGLGNDATEEDVRKLAGENFYEEVMGVKPKGRTDVFLGPMAVVLYLESDHDWVSMYSLGDVANTSIKGRKIGSTGFYRFTNRFSSGVHTSFGEVKSIPLIALHADVDFRGKGIDWGGDQVLEHESAHSLNHHVREILVKEGREGGFREGIVSRDGDKNVAFLKRQFERIRLAKDKEKSVLYTVSGDLSQERLTQFSNELVNRSLLRAKDEIVARASVDQEITPRLEQLENGDGPYDYFGRVGLDRNGFKDDPDVDRFINKAWDRYTRTLGKQARRAEKALRDHPEKRSEIVALLRERPIKKWGRELRRMFSSN